MLDRPQAELLERLGHLARLLAGVDVQREARAGRVPRDRDEPLARHGAQRVRRIADRHERVAGDGSGQALHPVQVGLDAAVAEAPLAGRRPAPAPPRA